MHEDAVSCLESPYNLTPQFASLPRATKTQVDFKCKRDTKKVTKWAPNFNMELPIFHTSFHLSV